MNVDIILDIMNVLVAIFLVSSFIIFILVLRKEIMTNQLRRWDYSLVFSIFILAWISLEVFSLIFGEESKLIDWLHFITLFLFAVWINVRFLWAMRAVRVK